MQSLHSSAWLGMSSSGPVASTDRKRHSWTLQPDEWRGSPLLAADKVDLANSSEGKGLYTTVPGRMIPLPHRFLILCRAHNVTDGLALDR